VNTAKKAGSREDCPPEDVVKKLQAKVANRVYCDAGPRSGMWRVDIGAIYLTDNELRVVLDS